MANQLPITFIICTYNRAEYLDNALDSLLSHTPDDFTFELLVIDNNSSDQTHAVVQKYQDITDKDRKAVLYFKETNQGLTYARNRGIREASAPNIVFLDDDIEATASLIPAWTSFFNNHPNALAAGGKIHVKFDELRPNWMSFFLLPLVGRHDLGDSLKKYPANKYPFGGNMGFKKSVFEDVGHFDTDIGKKGKKLYAKGEEKEMFQRIRSISDDIYYIPDAFVYHHVDGSRLTPEYVKKQALGIGRGIKYRLQSAPKLQFLQNGLSEIGKWLVSIPLALGYLLSFQPDKATMLFRFRWWILRGYWE